MLNPDRSRLYTDALRPPPGLRFVDAVATTYSLDLATLLTFPLHLALFSGDRPMEELMADGVTLLEALRRTAERVTVFADASHTLVPGTPQALFPLLESVVVEARAPNEGGAFHPKLWLLRFADPQGAGTRLRLLVLTRNLTADRSWDLILTLEGRPGPRPQDANRPLARLLSRLPDWSLNPPAASRSQKVQMLADLALRTEWELPEGYEEIHFHALGLEGGESWLPRPSDQLVVISPFLSDTAVRALLGTTAEPMALVSRPEELMATDSKLLERFQGVRVLAEEAELEDGEEPESDSARPGPPAHGLHAKAYLLKRGWRTHVCVGSANASVAALTASRNVEVMAELVGLSSRVGRVEDFFGDQGFGRLLTEFIPEEELEAEDPVVEDAREALEEARRRLAGARLRIRFTEGEETWQMELVPEGPLELAGIADIRAWLVTRKEGTAASVAKVQEGRPAPLPESLLVHVTSFVAFELRARAADERLRFVLSLRAEGLPVEERDAAVLRDVIRNREGFIRYVLLLLAEAGEDADLLGLGTGRWDRTQATGRSGDDLPVFEQLTRSYCREPERLNAVRRLLHDLSGQGGSDRTDGDVVPAEFLKLWAVFQEAVGLVPEEGP